MTDEAVEAVARVIFVRTAQQIDKDPIWETLSEHSKDKVRDVARDVINAYEANRTDVEELREALAKFGGHKAACRLNVRMGEPCACGWDQALTRISSLEKKGS